jgi:ArsR family transcriptional regulator, arsenate/arsenite/antimonite-responsive transcriptional repressor
MAKKGPQLDEVQMQAIARVLADPRRFAILQQIAEKGNCSCSYVREQQPISAATISHHMKELSDAGLVKVEHEGRTAGLIFQRDVWEAYLSQLSNI